jgi:hypothetical protein
MSLHELSACIYYKLAVDRGVRGCDPGGEQASHERLGTQVGVNEDVVEAIRLAPLALQAVYAEQEEELQRLAGCRGWDTLFCSLRAAPEQPAYAVFARRDTGRERCGGGAGEVGEVVVAIRGTASMQDIATDVRAAPHRFPPSTEEVDEALEGSHGLRDPERAYGSPQWVDQEVEGGNGGTLGDSFVPVHVQQWEWTQNMVGRYACRGMAVAALWTLREVGPALLQLASQVRAVRLSQSLCCDTTMMLPVNDLHWCDRGTV